MGYLYLMDSFKEMEKKNEIDKNIIKDINQTIKKLKKVKSNIYKKKISLSNRFSIFFGLETQEKILHKLRHRVSLAKEANDNPKVAEDALIILPGMFLLEKRIDLLGKGACKPASLLNFTTNLQMEALKYDLYPEQETKLRKFDNKIFKQISTGFIENVESIMHAK